MADYAGIGHVSQTLQDTLRAAITAAGPFAGTVVDLRSPNEIAAPAGSTMILSLWLYRVRRFDVFENAPLRIGADGRLRHAPLPLVLHYLLTPLANDEVNRHRLPGAAMQALHDSALQGAQYVPIEADGRDARLLVLEQNVTEFVEISAESLRKALSQELARHG